MQNDFLVGDIGGTNVRFALAAEGRLHHCWHEKVRAFSSFEAALAAFQKSCAPVWVSKAVLAVAAPIEGDEVALTNANWTISTSALRARFGLSASLLNDFAAIARAVPYLQRPDGSSKQGETGGGELCCIGPSLPPRARAHIAVIGPGTGLGTAGLIWTPRGWWGLQSEGGHVTMPACTEEEEKILRILRRRWDHVSAERVLSGPGLLNLYEAICQLNGVAPHLTQPEQMTAALTVPHKDLHAALSCRAFDVFCSMLGTVAGNLALTLGALGGLHLAGGILRRFPDAVQNSSFRTRFEGKGRLQRYLQQIPTFLILHDSPALIGLANWPDPDRFG